jgi:hypothetical protein
LSLEDTASIAKYGNGSDILESGVATDATLVGLGGGSNAVKGRRGGKEDARYVKGDRELGDESVVYGNKRGFL